MVMNMNTEILEQLDEFFEKKRMRLSEMRRCIFGGYRPDDVTVYVSELESETRLEIVKMQKWCETQVQALEARSERLEEELRGYHTCLDQIYKSVASLSQSFLTMVEQQKRREQLLQAYQQQLSNPLAGGLQGGGQLAQEAVQREGAPAGAQVDQTLPNPVVLFPEGFRSALQ